MSLRAVQSFVSPLTLVWTLASCGGDSRGVGPTSVVIDRPKPVVTSVSITPAEFSMGDESHVQLTALVEGSGPGVSQDVVWSLSDTSLARVNQGGVVSGICGRGGVVTISAISVVDPTMRATARATIFMLAMARLAIARVTTTTGAPVLLDSLTGSVEVVVSYLRHCGQPPFRVALGLRKGMVEAIAAESVVDAQMESFGTRTLRFDTNARDGTGGRVFPNGDYVLFVRAMFENQPSAVSVSFSVRIANP